MATPPPVICWTFFSKNRKTPTLALDLPPLAPWVQGLDRVRDRDLDQVQAAEHQQVELQVAERVRTLTIQPDKTVPNMKLSHDTRSYLYNLKAFCLSVSL